MKILNFPQNSSDFGDSLYKGSAVEGLRRQAMRWRAEEAAWCDRGKPGSGVPGRDSPERKSPLPLRHWSFYCKRVVLRNICQVNSLKEKNS